MWCNTEKCNNETIHKCDKVYTKENYTIESTTKTISEGISSTDTTESGGTVTISEGTYIPTQIARARPIFFHCSHIIFKCVTLRELAFKKWIYEIG